MRRLKVVWKHSLRKGARFGSAMLGVTGERVVFQFSDGGAMLLEAEFDHRLTGLGFEPSPVRPMGTDRLIVGLRDAIACVALE
jgi:hypothetical protein